MNALLKKTALAIFSLLFLCWLVTFLYLRFATQNYYQVSEAQKSQARAYLEGKLTPVPATWQWNTFNSEPGIELRTGLMDAENAKGTIIVVPGWTSFAELNMRTIVALNNAGYRVAHIEYRGQGKSTRVLRNAEKGHLESYAARAKEVADYASTVRIKNKPLFFFSESMGAHITLRMAAEYTLDVKAYLLLVPLIKMNTGTISYSVGTTLANILSMLGLDAMYAPGQSKWPDMPLVFGKAHDCNSNPDTAQRQSALFALDESLRSKGATMGMISKTAASTELILSPGYMDDLIQPVKMITAGIDALVNTDVSHQFCESLKNCEVTHFPEARHCLGGENQQRMDNVVTQTIAFFDKQLVAR